MSQSNARALTSKRPGRRLRLIREGAGLSVGLLGLVLLLGHSPLAAESAATPSVGERGAALSRDDVNPAALNGTELGEEIAPLPIPEPALGLFGGLSLLLLLRRVRPSSS